ncbi:MAG: hypothetical protein ACREID_05570 [Planctomycetota bacterium]
MKRYWLVLIALLVALTVSVIVLVERLSGVAERYKDKYEKVSADLRALDYPPAPFSAERFAQYLAVRERVAAVFRRRVAEPSDDEGHVFDTRILMLQELAEQLALSKMSLEEYRRLGARLRQLIGLKEFQALHGAWKETLSNQQRPDGLELPAPAEDATEEERGLVREHAAAIEVSMSGDWLVPILDRIAARR